MLLRDFSDEMQDLYFNNFCSACNLSSLVNEPICFKNSYNPLCIYLFLSFQNTFTIETGTSEFHKMVIKEISKTKNHSIQEP